MTHATDCAYLPKFTQIYFNALAPGGAASNRDFEPREAAKLAQFMQLG